MFHSMIKGKKKNKVINAAVIRFVLFANNLFMFFIFFLLFMNFSVIL